MLNRKGQSAGIGAGVGAAIGVVIIVAVIFIGLAVYGSLSSSLDRSGFTTAMNTTFDNVQANANSGFNILGLSPLVLAMAAIILMLVGGVGYLFMRTR